MSLAVPSMTGGPGKRAGRSAVNGRRERAVGDGQEVSPRGDDGGCGRCRWIRRTWAGQMKPNTVLAGKCSVDVTTYKEDTGVYSGFVFLEHGNTNVTIRLNKALGGQGRGTGRGMRTRLTVNSPSGAVSRCKMNESRETESARELFQ